MTKREKLLEKASNNPYGLSFDEFQIVLKRAGWRCPKNNAGSHRGWISPKGQKLMIQNLNGKAKGYQVQQFLEIYRKEKGYV